MPALRAQDSHNAIVVSALGAALVKGDTLQVLTPFTAASPLVVPANIFAPTLATNVANQGAPYPLAGYWQDASGMVRFKGKIQNNTGGSIASGATIFTIPTAFAPTETWERPCFGWTGSAATTYYVQLTSAGVGSMDGVAWPSGAQISLDMQWPVSGFVPYVPPSGFPFDVLWPKAYAPTLVLAQCLDSNAASPSNLSAMFVDWVTTVKGSKTFIHVRNIPGLLPGKSYSVTLLAL